MGVKEDFSSIVSRFLKINITDIFNIKISIKEAHESGGIGMCCIEIAKNQLSNL